MKLLLLKLFLIALIVTGFLYFVSRSYLQENAIRENGIPAAAVVTGAEGTGVVVNDNPRAKITLQVTAADRLPFEATRYCIVSELGASNFDFGVVHQVRIDPDDPTKIVFTEDICSEGSNGIISLTAVILVSVMVFMWNGWPFVRGSAFPTESGETTEEPQRGVPSRSPADRMEELNDLRTRGLITEDEYQEKRAGILEGL